jgi:CarboxypepD_reg-like domain
MNNADKHIDSWSMTDVQKYLDGELSAPEMHELEKLALDDPFLADALEGLQTRQGPAREEDLADLRARLDARTTTTSKKRLLPLLRIAAVLVLLVGLGFTAIYTLFYRSVPAPPPTAAATTQTAPVAKAPPPPAPPGVASTPPAVASIQPEAKRTPVRRAAPKTQTHRPAAAANLPAVADAKSLAHTPQTIVADSSSSRNDSRDVVVEAYGAHRRPALMETFVPAQSLRNALQPKNFVVFSGKVLDFNNQPVAGAALLFKSHGAGTVTDREGYFSLYLPQKDTTRQVTVAMDGYEVAQYALNTNDMKGNVIYLKPSQSQAKLDEVLVSGLDEKRREFRAAPPSDDPEVLDSLWLKTEPVMGHDAYLAYLEKAKKTLAVDTTLQGIESISFLVDKKGALSEFKIERSLSPAHDAGVIRLITEGPSWKMLRGRTARALVNVAFP